MLNSTTIKTQKTAIDLEKTHKRIVGASEIKKDLPRNTNI